MFFSSRIYFHENACSISSISPRTSLQRRSITVLRSHRSRTDNNNNNNNNNDDDDDDNIITNGATERVRINRKKSKKHNRELSRTSLIKNINAMEVRKMFEIFVFAASSQYANAVEAREYLTATGEVFQPTPTEFDSGNVGILLFTLALGVYGMITSFENQAETTEAATVDRVRKQMEYLDLYATSEKLIGRDVVDVRAIEMDLAENGVSGVKAILKKETSDEMLKYVNDAIEKENDKGTNNPNFGNVYSRKNRFDYKVDLRNPVVKKALQEACASLKEIIEKTCGKDAELLELAALISDPESSRQPIHPDTNYRPNLTAVTTFVALQDVTEQMGPTLFIPKTNTSEAHTSFKENLEIAGPSLAKPNVLAIMNKGDCSLFDSRLLHCGLENKSAKRRILFYFTFGPKNADNPNRGFSTIREDIRNQFSFNDF